MSSLVRRIEKSMMKRVGYERNRWFLRKTTAEGVPQVIKVRRGGEVTDPDGNPIGRRWPLRLPARARPSPDSPWPPRANHNRGLNDCWRPSNEASKPDLAEFHEEKMGIKRARRRP